MNDEATGTQQTTVNADLQFSAPFSDSCVARPRHKKQRNDVNTIDSSTAQKQALKLSLEITIKRRDERQLSLARSTENA